MKTILTAVLAALVSFGAGCSSGGEKAAQMASCAGCKMECPKDKVCPKDGKCAKCDTNCGKPMK